MDAIYFAMFLKKSGVQIDKSVNGVAIVDVVDFISDDTQKKIADIILHPRVVEELLIESIRSTGIKKLDSEIDKRVNNKTYIEELTEKFG